MQKRRGQTFFGTVGYALAMLWCGGMLDAYAFFE
jgi:hypothetical protein